MMIRITIMKKKRERKKKRNKRKRQKRKRKMKRRGGGEGKEITHKIYDLYLPLFGKISQGCVCCYQFVTTWDSSPK
jgi:hypothetical protein